MPNIEDVKNKEFTTTAGEVMKVGADVLTEMVLTSPNLVIIEDTLSLVIAAVAAKLVSKKFIDEKEE